jgi:hypothetical protein
MLDQISFHQFHSFIILSSHLRAQIELSCRDNQVSSPPNVLPENIMQFLGQALFSLDNEATLTKIRHLWKALSEFIWSLGTQEAPKQFLPLFLAYGTPLGIG